MLSVFIRVLFATGLFAGLHSLLATHSAKQRATHYFGDRQRNGLYRAFYIAQSALTLGGLMAYLAALPDREIYHVRGWPAGLTRLGQAAGLVFATAVAYQVGLARITGLGPLLAWLRGDRRIAPEPEAQGPAPSGENPRGELAANGPFCVSRHPLNLSPVPVFWLAPRMTVKRLAFNLAGTLYLVLGSIHEEWRLSKAYPERYARYQNSGVRFFL
jgi:methanethiol S-methyltransferase